MRAADEDSNGSRMIFTVGTSMEDDLCCSTRRSLDFERGERCHNCVTDSLGNRLLCLHYFQVDPLQSKAFRQRYSAVHGETWGYTLKLTNEKIYVMMYFDVSDIDVLYNTMFNIIYD